MKKNSLIIFLFSVSLVQIEMDAQSLMSVAGGTVTTANMYLSYSIGETVTGTANNVNIVTIGYQQPSPMVITAVLAPSDQLISVYPNPVKNFITVSSPFPDLHVIIYDLNGRSVHEQTYHLESGRVEIDANEWAAGNYILRGLSIDQKEVYGQLKLLKL
jgi:hypothetical protein